MKAFLLLTIFYCHLVNGQSLPSDSVSVRVKARNAIYLEVGGTAVVYSVNYDRLLVDHKTWKMGGRVGFSLLNSSLYDSRFLAEVYTLKAFNKRQSRYFEFGIGFVYRTPRLVSETNRLTDSPSWGLSPRIGVRFQKAESGWLTRIGFTPNFSWQSGESLKIVPWAGFSVGRSF